MALLNVTNIQIDNNPANFQMPIKMHITFECLKDVPEEDVIDWELIYIGSAKDESQDIVLDSFSMGQLDKGVMQFTIESEAPDYKKIPSKEDLLNITAIILSVSYKKQEFFRVGYYVYNQYTDAELIENDPPEVLIDKVQRSILADKPRITRFPINWDGKQNAAVDTATNGASKMFGGDSEFPQILQELHEKSQSQLFASAHGAPNAFAAQSAAQAHNFANAIFTQNGVVNEQQAQQDEKQAAFNLPQGGAFSDV